MKRNDSAVHSPYAFSLSLSLSPSLVCVRMVVCIFTQYCKKQCNILTDNYILNETQVHSVIQDTNARGVMLLVNLKRLVSQKRVP